MFHTYILVKYMAIEMQVSQTFTHQSVIAYLKDMFSEFDLRLSRDFKYCFVSYEVLMNGEWQAVSMQLS
jgi:hypothetical protein